MCRDAKGDCHVNWKWRFWYAVLGTFIGTSVWISFGHMRNPHASWWGLTSGVFAFWYAIYVWYNVKPEEQQGGASPLLDAAAVAARSHIERAYLIAGILGSTAACCGFFIYIIDASIAHETLTGQSRWMGAVWTWMTFKWAFGLAHLVWRRHRWHDTMILLPQ